MTGYRTNTENRYADIIFWVSALVLLFGALGGTSLHGSEERWAEVTREMFRSGDFFHPTINGEPYFDKPLLSYWLIALVSLAAGSITEWPVRLPSAVAGILALWATRYLGRALWSKDVERVAGWLLLLSYGFLWWGRRGEADMENMAAVILAVAWYWKCREDTGFGGYLVFYLICFVGAQAKGLAPIVIPAVVLLPDLMRGGRWKRHLNVSHLIALLIGISVYMVPFLYASFTRPGYESSGLGLVFQENIQRFFKPIDHKEPFYVYFYYLPQLFLPWSFFLVFAVPFLLRSLRRPYGNSRWLSEAVLLIFILFTLSGSRRFYYILPIIPFSALLTALYIDRGAWRWSYYLETALFAVAGALLLISPFLWHFAEQKTGFSPPADIIRLTPVMGLFALAPLAVYRLRPGLPDKVLGAGKKISPLIISALIIAAGGLCWQLGRFDEYRTTKPFSAEVRNLTAGIPPDNIAVYGKFPPDIIFYAELPVPVRILKDVVEVRNFVGSAETAKVLLAMRKDVDDFLSALPENMRQMPALSEKVHPWEKRADKKVMVWRIGPEDLKEAGGT